MTTFADQSSVTDQQLLSPPCATKQHEMKQIAQRAKDITEELTRVGESSNIPSYVYLRVVFFFIFF